MSPRALCIEGFLFLFQLRFRSWLIYSHLSHVSYRNAKVFYREWYSYSASIIIALFLPQTKHVPAGSNGGQCFSNEKFCMFLPPNIIVNLEIYRIKLWALQIECTGRFCLQAISSCYVLTPKRHFKAYDASNVSVKKLSAGAAAPFSVLYCLQFLSDKAYFCNNFRAISFSFSWEIVYMQMSQSFSQALHINIFVFEWWIEIEWAGSSL